MKHDEYVYVDFILNDMDHEYNNGYDNDWDVDKWMICKWYSLWSDLWNCE